MSQKLKVDSTHAKSIIVKQSELEAWEEPMPSNIEEAWDYFKKVIATVQNEYVPTKKVIPGKKKPVRLSYNRFPN